MFPELTTGWLGMWGLQRLSKEKRSSKIMALLFCVQHAHSLHFWMRLFLTREIPFLSRNVWEVPISALLLCPLLLTHWISSAWHKRNMWRTWYPQLLDIKLTFSFHCQSVQMMVHFCVLLLTNIYIEPWELLSALISIANKLDILVCKYYILNFLALNIHAYLFSCI